MMDCPVIRSQIKNCMPAAIVAAENYAKLLPNRIRHLSCLKVKFV